MKRNVHQRGFSLVIALVVVIVVAGLAFAGWYVWNKDKRNNDTNSNNNSSQNSKSNAKEEEQPDPYNGWLTYTNAEYGISFKYPIDWKVREEQGTTADATIANSLTVRHAVILELKEEFKYNQTVNIEVLNQSLDATTAYYDSYYAQADSNEITKTYNDLKGRKSVQYKVINGGEDSRLYLFDVNGKVYSFSSLGSAKLDPDFWPKFEKVFNSLKI